MAGGITMAQPKLVTPRPATKPATDGADRSQTLLAIANLLATKLEPDVLFSTVARIVRTILPIDRASLAIYDPDRDVFEVVALALHEHSSLGKGWTVPHRGSRAGKAFDERRPYLSPALGEGTPFIEDAQLVKEGMRTGLNVPLLVDGQPIGTFNVNCRSQSALRAVDVELLAKIADQIAIAVANSRAFQSIRRQKEALEREKALLLDCANVEPSAESLLLHCPSMTPFLDRLRTLAKVDATVLVTGETGTGKGVVARSLHAWSSRSARAFVKCDCAALSPTLIESELFGHERGAFTGAQSRRIGRFEMSQHGTIFLDEIAELPLETQGKLLGILEDRSVLRVGGSESIPVDMRVIAATNRNLGDEVAAGRFRRDLYFRLNVLNVELRPLRERPSDILPLAEYFVRRYSRSFGRSTISIGAAAAKTMAAYAWPGNIRELANVIERAMLLQSGATLEIPAEVFAGKAPSAVAADPAREGDRTLADVERRHIRRILDETAWRIDGPKGAAVVLGLHPNTLRSRMAKLSIRRPPPVG